MKLTAVSGGGVALAMRLTRCIARSFALALARCRSPLELTRLLFRLAKVSCRDFVLLDEDESQLQLHLLALLAVFCCCWNSGLMKDS